MIPGPRAPQEQELPPGGDQLVAALREMQLPSVDDEARARLREQVVRAARSGSAR